MIYKKISLFVDVEGELALFGEEIVILLRDYFFSVFTAKMLKIFLDWEQVAM